MKARCVLICILGVTVAQENVTTYPKGYVRHRTTPDDLVDVLNISQADSTPSHIDWHHAGQITAIKNQGQCGSCWAFSTIEGVETAVYRKNKQLHHYSTEELVTCDHYDGGCNGGDVGTAVKYLEEHGVATADDYPDHTSKMPWDSFCRWNKKAVVKVTGHSYAVKPCSSSSCGHQSESALATAVASHGPMSICINSGQGEEGDWQRYNSGVMTKSCAADGHRVDHCVQLIGYSKVASTPYWRIRNSWGTSWGESGFIRIAYGKGNKCCVACEATHISAELHKSEEGAAGQGQTLETMV